MLNNDWHEGIQIRSYWCAWKTHSEGISSMPWWLFFFLFSRRNTHKRSKAASRRLLKTVYTLSGFCFWLMEQEIQTRRFTSVWRKVTVIVRSLMSLLFLSLHYLFLFALYFLLHFCPLGSIFLKVRQTLPANTFTRWSGWRNEWKLSATGNFHYWHCCF